MTRVISFLLSALVALLAVVHAKSKGDQIRVYAFTSDWCYGPPAGPNIDVKRDECKNIPDGVRSIKPMFDPKRSKWLDDVNAGGTYCEVVTYKSLNCQDGMEFNFNALPENLHACLHGVGAGLPISIFSIRFRCGDKNAAPPSTTNTATLVSTSWTVGPDEVPTPHMSTTVVEQTQREVHNIARRSPEPSGHHIEPREEKRDSKGVWMFHPWARSLICYECYHKKEDDWHKVHCVSGPNNPIDCGVRSVNIDGTQLTVTTTTTTTLTDPSTTTLYELTTSTVGLPESTVTTITTTISGDTSTVSPLPLVERRSWHRHVTFDHPYQPGTQLCADAEWEKRGQPGAEIKLQKVGEDMKKCLEDPKTQSIDLPEPAQEILTESTTVTSTVLVTGTHTVFVGPPGIIEEERGFTTHGDL
ncbi:Mitochondrial GTPase 1 [Neocucurbitaria cava]|uniref:Mitochondrial GTPase 1 n=1 Tax=Neocucurbitaria cava TaxID=798079 RepID=A0A9W8Y022_9PLEO|nr:Mitochondrial GTPase 1 [Neocucurbitaria cava]